MEVRAFLGYMAEWWNGRHEGLKIPCPHGRVGSTPTSATNNKIKIFIMEFTKDVIKEFWSKEFKSANFSFRRQDWIPDKYNTVAHYPDSIMQKTVVIWACFGFDCILVG